jgi:hypothetical protein
LFEASQTLVPESPDKCHRHISFFACQTDNQQCCTNVPMGKYLEKVSLLTITHCSLILRSRMVAAIHPEPSFSRHESGIVMADISVLQKNSFRHAYNSGVLEQLVYDV